MRSLQISNIFMAIEALEEAFTNAAGRQAMDEHQANDLLKMVKACTMACTDATQALPGMVEHARPTPGLVTPGEAAFMDETMSFTMPTPTPPKVRNIAGTLSGSMKDINALTPEQIRALPIEGLDLIPTQYRSA